MAYAVEYDEFGNPIYPVEAPASSTPPPLYGGPVGSTYTDFSGNTQTVPENNWEATFDAEGNPTYTPVPPASSTATAQPSGANNESSDYGGPKDFVSLVRYWQGQHPATTPDIDGLIAFLSAQGVPVTRATHAGGLPSEDKLIWNGKTYDIGSSLGSPTGRWFSDFLTDDGTGGAADTGAFGGGDFAIDPSYLSPFTQPFPQSPSLPGFQAPDDAVLRQFPNVPAFAYQDFEVPTAQDVLADPGYNFRVDQGLKSIEASAAARGLLHSGGTLADIIGFGQNLGSQEYGNVFDRKLNSYNTNRANAADTYRTNYNTQYVDPYAYGTNRANTLFDRANTQFQNETAGSKELFNRGVTQWQQARDLWFQNQQNPFNKLFSLSSLGLNAAQS